MTLMESIQKHHRCLGQTCDRILSVLMNGVASLLQDWIEFEEIADLEERAKSHFFEKENEEVVQKTQAAAKEKEFQSVRATKDQVGEVRTQTSMEGAVLPLDDDKGVRRRKVRLTAF